MSSKDFGPGAARAIIAHAEYRQRAPPWTFIFISKETFELFQTELFSSLLHQYKNWELPYSTEPGCISGLQSQQEEQPAFWLPRKLCSPRKSDETFECAQACSSTV